MTFDADVNHNAHSEYEAIGTHSFHHTTGLLAPFPEA